ncbi:MAG TPA: UDP-N-acetylmuramate dehydrogenase [Verrucomicrobiae bacterium]
MMFHAPNLNPEMRMDAARFNDFSRRLSPETRILCDEPLARRTTLRVGGPADLLIEPATEDDLATVVRLCRAQRMPLMILGRGSNLLVKDSGFRGVVVCLAHPHFSRIEVNGCRLVCGAGARLKAVASEAKRGGIGKLEFLEGIPGSVGGALRMNAGAMGSAIFDVVEKIRVMDFSGNIEERLAAQVVARYRSCPFLKERLALSVVLVGEAAERQAIEERLGEYNRRRWTSQPAAPSAGCVFKNPGELPAGRLIDELGLKGTRVGGAMVSHEHGNFIINAGGATAQDILDLIELIRRRARAERGIELETEVQIVGD